MHLHYMAENKILEANMKNTREKSMPGFVKPWLDAKKNNLYGRVKTGREWHSFGRRCSESVQKDHRKLDFTQELFSNGFTFSQSCISV